MGKPEVMAQPDCRRRGPEVGFWEVKIHRNWNIATGRVHASPTPDHRSVNLVDSQRFPRWRR